MEKKKKGHRAWTQEEDDFLQRYYMEHSQTEMGKALGRSSGSTSLRCNTLGYVKEKIEPIDSVNNKICTRCKRELPKSRFSKSKSRKDGLNCWCKDCTSEKNKIDCAENRHSKSEFLLDKQIIDYAKQKTAKEEKRCTGCGEVKLGSEFYFLNKRLSRESMCKVCSKKNAEKYKIEKIKKGESW